MIANCIAVASGQEVLQQMDTDEVTPMSAEGLAQWHQRSRRPRQKCQRCSNLAGNQQCNLNTGCCCGLSRLCSYTSRGSWQMLLAWWWTWSLHLHLHFRVTLDDVWSWNWGQSGISLTQVMRTVFSGAKATWTCLDMWHGCCSAAQHRHLEKNPRIHQPTIEVSNRY
jgi:hypothetical protein